MEKKQIELLSPAGDYNSFLAAMRAGADAVYLGGDKYGARAYAKNFTREEVLKAIDYAHLLGKKVYLTVNTLFKNEELFELCSYLESFYLAGIDGVIVQDIGVLSYIRRYFPGLPLHASTQLAITDIEGVLLLKELGVERVVLARELSLSEIAGIHQETEMELECFIHGALCYCYSGKCLFSSLVGGRSGNRGRCAQPCRLPYNGQYLLSAKDICTLQLLPQLIDSGITSFKIEGRMKNLDYVAGVTGIYRKYMDFYLHNKGNNFQVEQSDLENLLMLYTRSGNSKGYYFQKNGRDMITIEKPGYQTADEKKRNAVYNKYAGSELKIPLEAFVSLKKGEPALFRLVSNSEEVCVSSGIIEGANRQPLTEDAVRKQLMKTGGTLFTVNKLHIEMEPDIFIPVGQLNELRRLAIKSLTDKLLNQYRRTLLITNRVKLTDKEKNDKNTTFAIHCGITTMEQLDVAINHPFVDIISVPISLFEKPIKEESGKNNITEVNKSILKRVASKRKRIILIFPNIIRNRYFERKKNLLDWLLIQKEVGGVLVSNYESLFYLKKIHYSKEIIGDFHLYAWNKDAHDTLISLGCTKTTVPIELNKKELLRRGIFGEDLFFYGRLPMMISAQCVKNTIAGCNVSPEVIEITDRYGTKFPCKNECGECYNIIWNSVPVSLHGEQAILERLRTDSIRLQFTTETEEQMEKILNFYEEELYNGIRTDTKPQMPFTEFTKGHLNRGVE